MPQVQLPIFSEGVTPITNELGYQKRDGKVTFFNGSVPVFSHDESDIQTFRMITSQFCINGNTTQRNIVDAFGVPMTTVKRYCKLYRDKGAAGFYAPRATRGPAVLVPAVLQKAQDLLDQDMAVEQVAKELGLKKNTVDKAIRYGRLHKPKKKLGSSGRSVGTDR